MVGLQYLFLEPNADDPLNKGWAFSDVYSSLTFVHFLEAALEMSKNRDVFVSNVKSSMVGRTIKGISYDNVLVR